MEKHSAKKQGLLFRLLHIHPDPSQSLAAGFAIIILVGALLLNLPIATHSGESIGFLDALFTATSAACVTGLVVVNTLQYWSPFGKLVILILIQIGGLGVMTIIASGLIFLRKQISLRERLVIQASFNQDAIGGMVRLVKRVLYLTLIIEAIGGLFLTIGFYFTSSISLGRAIIMGIFHSISAFCNAGFDIVGEQSLAPFVANPYMNIVFMLLIVGGGIGYPVWNELLAAINKKRKEKVTTHYLLTHLSVHSKMALSITAFLLISGSLFFLLLEWDNPATLGSLSVGGKLWAAVFQSVTLRTAGFSTIDQAGLHEASRFISSILMFIGGSPAGTAGGVKTITLGVIFFTMLSVLRGRNRIEAFHRTLSMELLQKALTVASLLGLVVLGGTILLSFTEQNNTFSHSFLDLLFECASAAGTVGITTGITPFLSIPGKVVIILSMFIGRLGPVTVAFALTLKLNRQIGDIRRPEGRVIVG